MKYQTLDDTSATIALWYVVNTSLSAFYKLTQQFGNARQALNQSQNDWQALNIHGAHIKRWQDVDDVMAVVNRLYEERERGAYGIITREDDTYPDMLSQMYDPPPLLFYRGNLARLSDKQIAIVGSRKPTEFAKQMTFNMAEYLAYEGLTVTSGLAGGVDRAAHLGGLSGATGRTVGVMGVGIDVCYPKNHNALYAQIIHEGGCLISELLPATPASKHTFPRRNRLVAGLSLATLVTEATIGSGSLITAHLAAEQGKQVFAVPSTIDNMNAEGCHHLIREGATLIYHPAQIIDELREWEVGYNALPKSFSHGISVFDEAKMGEDENTAKHAESPHVIPPHLLTLFEQLSTKPMDLDALVIATGADVGLLLASLMELEMLGVITVVGGRYAKI